ncbi:MAG: N-6 DNA methylase [Nitrososphaeria archaeon]
MEINAIIPENFKDMLNEYLNNIKQREDELDKRAYFKSTILEKWFGINPNYIYFEAKRRDLYFSGILFETKKKINDKTRNEAFVELKKYINSMKNPVIKAVVTDMVRFEVYDPEKLKTYTENNYENFVKEAKVYEINLGSPNDIFGKLYELLYTHSVKLPIDTKIIVPRMLSLINKLSSQITITSENIKFIAWTNFISIALGSKKEAGLELFKRYVILYYISILSVAKALNINANTEDIINGSAFVTKGILNFTDDEDFFNILKSDDKVIVEIINELNNYDFEKQNIEADVFRLLYEELISPSDRHSLGEFYTPDWLAKYIINELVTKDNVVLDPSCGSGTFLKLAIKRKAELGSINIEDQIVGFDINPIAVIVAKANILLELKKPISIIPVFVADSLMPELQIKQKQLTEEYVTINFEDIVKGYGTEKFYYGGYSDPKDMHAYIKKMAEVAKTGRGYDTDTRLYKNKALIDKISDLITHKKNHIWFYIIQNIYNPYYYLGKVDVVVGNPPWLTYKDVESIIRQKFLDNLYRYYNLGSGSENKTHQDMAAFFIARTQEYLRDKENGKIGFVLPRAIFDSSQYDTIRRATVSANDRTKTSANTSLPKISKIYDLSVKINPFRRTSCIIIFDFKSSSSKVSGFFLDSEQKVKINQVPKIKILPKTFYINTTKNESGIGNIKLKNRTAKEIAYKEDFKQGASIVPRPYYFVDIINEEGYGFKVSGALEYKKENKRKRKKNWCNFPDNSIIEKHLLYNVITGENLQKYRYSLKTAVLPLLNNHIILKEIPDPKENHYLIKPIETIDSEINKVPDFANATDEEKEIAKKLITKMSSIYQKFEDDWESLRGNKFNTKSKISSQKMGVLDRLNYNNELTMQLSDALKYIVVYNKSGHEIKCCVIKDSRLIIDHECIYYKTNNKNEAYYLEGIINSKFLLKLFSESGIKTERHIEKKIFELGIPRYNKNNKIHFEITKLAEEYEKTKNGNLLNKIEELVSKIMK